MKFAGKRRVVREQLRADPKLESWNRPSISDIRMLHAVEKGKAKSVILSISLNFFPKKRNTKSARQ